MIRRLLLTGFGPFPGAPFNPTGPLVTELARRHPTLQGARCVAHVFPTSYADVDRELPLLVARTRPDIVVMFGVATRSRHLRIETCARNALALAIADASGRRPEAAVIAPGAPPHIALRVPAQRLLAAVRAAGVPAALSRDAGAYLCNYLCWRMSEPMNWAPRLAAFVHVPPVRPRPARGFAELVRASEAILRAAVAAPKVFR